jgi:hypothetical protein
MADLYTVQTYERDNGMKWAFDQSNRSKLENKDLDFIRFLSFIHFLKLAKNYHLKSVLL